MDPRHARSALGHLAAYTLTVVLGLEVARGGDGTVYFWPAAGIAALWMLSGRTRDEVLLDGGLLVLGTAVAHLALGGSAAPAVLFGLANLSLGLAVRAGSALSEHRSFWGRLPRRLSCPRDLVNLGLGSVAGALASAPAGLVAVYLAVGDLTWTTATGFLVRNTCSTFVVAGAVLALLTTLMRVRSRRGWAAMLTPEPRRFWAVELLAAGSISLGATVIVFGSAAQRPIAFLMVVSATWIGYRFSPAVGGTYAMTFSTLAVLFTEAGRGPFGPIENHVGRAILVQVFILVMSAIVLMLSLGVFERAALLARVVESEARATSRAELLDAITHVMADGLVVLDPSGAVMMRNPAAEALAGHRSDTDGPGTANAFAFLRPDGTQLEPSELPHLRALRGESVPAEDLVRVDPRTGQQLTLSITAVPLHHSEPGGEPLAVVAIHDVTRERAHLRELQAFAATVAHDLKAPLTGVGSWAEILGDQLDVLGVDVTEPRSSLRRIESSATRMTQLISDLLAYSQAQSATLTPTALSLTGMVDAVARELRESSAGPLPVFEYDAIGRVRADRVLVHQLLSNVLGNAVKYVAPGTTPRVRITGEPVGDMIEVRVSDNGIGIPQAERGRIFDSFYRASSSGSYPGTGLGLAICVRAVERHGGRISAREGLGGQGTTLIFTLPADPEPVAEPADSQPHLDGRTTSADPPPRRTGSETAVR